MPLTRRASRRLRIGSCIVVVVAPILGAIAEDPMAVVNIHASGPVVHPTDTSEAGRALAVYLEDRNTLVDRLLPEGAGGTLWKSDLGPEMGGVAFAASATIAISLRHRLDLEAVEVHERAHLLHAAHPDAVDQLMATLPAPHPEEYAARNTGEHFAEAASGAWHLVTLPTEGVCLADTPAGLLRHAEQRVPGTAGFLSWFLDQPELAAYPDRPELRKAADELLAPYRSDWDRVQTAIAARRRDDGTFAPWPALGLADRLKRSYRRDRDGGNWLVSVAARLTLPAIGIATVIDRVRPAAGGD